VICVGDRDDVLAHIAAFKAKVTGFAHRLGLPLAVEAATDPFSTPTPLARWWRSCSRSRKNSCSGPLRTIRGWPSAR
jgi:hypothetical protein